MHSANRIGAWLGVTHMRDGKMLMRSFPDMPSRDGSLQAHQRTRGGLGRAAMTERILCGAGTFCLLRLNTSNQSLSAGVVSRSAMRGRWTLESSTDTATVTRSNTRKVAVVPSGAVTVSCGTDASYTSVAVAAAAARRLAPPATSGVSDVSGVSGV